MKSLIEAHVRLVLRYRRLVLAITLAITLAAASIYPRAVVSTSFKAMFFGEQHPLYSRYVERIQDFGSDVVFIIGIETDANPLSAEVLPKLEAAQKNLEDIEYVRRVASIVSLQRTGLVGDTIAVRDFSEEAKRDPARVDALIEEIREDPAAGGIMVSKSGRAMTFVVVLEHDEKRDAEALPRILRLIERAIESAGFARERTHYAGMPTVIDAIIGESIRNIVEMLPIVAILLLLAVYMMFGRMWPVFINSVSALLAVAWAMAFSIWRDPAVNVMISLVPCFVLIISFSDVVHMCSAYLLELEGDGEDGEEVPKEEAIVAAVVDVGAACFLTSLTTGIGFLSMVFVPTPVFKQLGTVSFVGVGIAYLLAITLVPALLGMLPRPKPWGSMRVGLVQRMLDHALDAMMHVSMTRPWIVIALFSSVIVLGLYGSSRVVFEAEFSNRLSEDNVVRQDQAFFEEEFQATTFVDLYIEVPEENGLLDSERFDEIVELERAIEALPEVDQAVSMVDVLEAAHTSIVGDAPGAKPFTPSTDEQLAQLLILVQMQGPDAYSELMDFSHRTMKISVYTTDEGIRAQNRLARTLVTMAEERLGGADAKVELEAFSLSQMMGSWVDDILLGQLRGLSASFVIITIILIIGFRSVRIGLISMFPNALPLLAMGAWCGLAWETTDTDAVLVGMMAIGIGVDDTIHFVSRYLLEAKRRPRLEAIRETFRFSGRGIFITTFIFVLGFFPMVRSDYLIIEIIGYLLPAAFVIALAADLLFVPAMIQVGWLAVEEPSDASE